MRAQFILQEVWTGLRRNLTMTAALIVVVAISLALLGTGLLFVKQVDDTRTYWQGKVQLSIYLCTTTSVSPACKANGPATAAEKAQIATDLRALPQVQHVYYESQAQAFQHFNGTLPRPGVHQPGHQVRDPRLVPGQAVQHAGGLQHRGGHGPGPAGRGPGGR
jgi:cell division protein FtsX